MVAEQHSWNTTTITNNNNQVEMNTSKEDDDGKKEAEKESTQAHILPFLCDLHYVFFYSLFFVAFEME